MHFEGNEKDFWDMTISEVLFYIRVKDKRRTEDFRLYSYAVEQGIINQFSKRSKRLDVFKQGSEIDSNAFKDKEEKQQALAELYKKMGVNKNGSK